MLTAKRARARVMQDRKRTAAQGQPRTTILYHVGMYFGYRRALRVLPDIVYKYDTLSHRWSCASIRTPGSRGISYCVLASHEPRVLPAGAFCALRMPGSWNIQARIWTHISVCVPVILMMLSFDARGSPRRTAQLKLRAPTNVRPWRRRPRTDPVRLGLGPRIRVRRPSECGEDLTMVGGGGSRTWDTHTSGACRVSVPALPTDMPPLCPALRSPSSAMMHVQCSVHPVRTLR